MTISNCICGKKPKLIPGKGFYETFGTGMVEVKCDCGCCVSVSRKDKPSYSFMRKTAIRVWNEVCGGGRMKRKCCANCDKWVDTGDNSIFCVTYIKIGARKICIEQEISKECVNKECCKYWSKEDENNRC